jgi:RNA polymerase sigma-B factor
LQTNYAPRFAVSTPRTAGEATIMDTPRQASHNRRTDSDRLRDERHLFERFCDPHDPVDRDMLVERFLPLARSLAGRYVRHEEPFEDIFQVACVGLVKAIDGYDVTRGRAFSSYAVPTIVGEIKRYYRDRTWSVHVPRDLQELTLRVGRAADEFERTHMRKPTVRELGEELNAGDEDILDALQARRAHRSDSLDAPAPSADGDESARTVSDTIGTHEPGYARAERRATISQLTRGLTPRDRLILRLRFEHDLTQKQIGSYVGISQMQVSRVLRQAIRKLNACAERAHAA